VPDTVINLTARKGAGGASDLEQANNVVKSAASAHQWTTRRVAGNKKEDMKFSRNGNE
jgi:hypothetical protein